MARYDYRCPKCDIVFEVEHPMSEHPVVTCPQCGTEAQRVFSAAGIRLQGSGFYSTDNRGGSSGGSSSKCAHCSGGDCSNC